MADRFWISGGTTNVNSTSNWSTTSGGATGASVPGAGDNAIFDANSGTGTVLFNAIATWHSLDATNSSNTFNITGARQLTVGGAATDTTASVFTLGASVTWNMSGGTQTIVFDNRSGGITVTSSVNLTSVSALEFGTNASQATTTLASNFNISGCNLTTYTRGVFNLAGYTLTLGDFISSSNNTRTLTATNSTINCSGNWTLSGSNHTVTTTGSTINMTGTDKTFTGNGKTYVTVNFTGSGTTTHADANTYTTFNFTNGLGDTLSLAASPTIASGGTLTLQGASQTAPTRVISNVLGTARAFAFAGGSPTIDVDNVNFRDITSTGATITGNAVGDLGGNTSVTATTPVTRYWIGNAGNWNDTAEWSSTSGGSGGSTMPLPQDIAIFDANSFSADGHTVTCAVIDYSEIDTTATDQTHTLNFTTYTPHVYGDLNLHASRTTLSSTNNVVLASRGSKTVGGGTVSAAILVEAVGGTYTLGSDFTTSSTIVIQAGTLSTSGFNLSCTTLTPSGTLTKAFTGHASSTLTLTGTGNILVITGTGYTFTTNTINITATNTGAVAKTIEFTALAASKTYGNLTLPSGSGTLNLDLGLGASATFGNFTVNHSVARTISFAFGEGAGVQKFIIGGTVTMSGSAGQLLTINSDLGATAFVLEKTSGTVSCDYLHITNSDAIGGASWYAGANSTDNGNNTGWIFTAPPTKGFPFDTKLRRSTLIRR